jgi:endonuclease YncB( thermonuclease family)
MARILKPQFGSRHHRTSPHWNVGGPRGKRRRFDWQLLTLVALVFVASFVWLFPALDEQTGTPLKDVADAPRPSGWSSPIQVVDGDTVRKGGETYRLVGFNTPESGLRAHCGRERALASKAQDRLREIVNAADVAPARVACACLPGTEGTRGCNHGRLCGTLSADGRDVGSILIAEGLAEAYACGTTSCPKRKDWCAG